MKMLKKEQTLIPIRKVTRDKLKIRKKHLIYDAYINLLMDKENLYEGKK